MKARGFMGSGIGETYGLDGIEKIECNGPGGGAGAGKCEPERSFAGVGEMVWRRSGEGDEALRAVDANVRVSEGAGGGGGFVSETTPSAAEKRARHASPLRWWRVVSLILLAAIFFFVGRQLGRDFKELRAQNISVSVNWLYLGASLICLMGARLTNAVNTWLLLRALGAELPVSKVVAVIWMASLGRYIPGKVAVVAGSMAMLMRMGARFSVVGAALTLSTGIMILIGMVGSIPLFFLGGMRERLPSAEIFGAMMAGMAVVCLYPPIFLGICNVGLRMIGREELPKSVRQGPFGGAIGVGVIRIGFVSMSLWLAARS